MRYKQPLRKILGMTRPCWDGPKTRPSIRRAFLAAIKCQTGELGAEVFSSPGFTKIVPHTCKSRACPTCGYRAMLQWLRERWAALPNVPYKAITFTMPDCLWSIFRDNPELTKALPALAAGTICAHAIFKQGVRVGVIGILHTFNPRLEFNSHVHTMVTAGGLSERSGSWISSVFYDHDEIMQTWRKSVIGLLRSALRSNLLRSNLGPEEMEDLLARQEKRRWMIRIQLFPTKEHFLRYAGRYVRRPPIAQKRIVKITWTSVTFWAKDKKLGRRVCITCSLEEFIDRWSQHISERYWHAVRNFGLFSPRGLRQMSGLVFRTLGQRQKKRPSPRRWADSIKRDFGWDPLLDPNGNRMRWVGRLSPIPGT